MTTSHGGGWTRRFACIYYVLGSVHQLYNWLFVLGFVTAVGSFFETTPKLVHYCTPALSLVSLYAGVTFWRRQFAFQLNGPNPGLSFEHLEIFYKEIDDKNCEAQRRASVKAIYPIDHYVHKFMWSGDGDAVAEVITGAMRAEVMELPTEIEKCCRIYFERHLNKQEHRVFAYKLTLRNASKPLKSFLGHALDTPTGTLVMKVEFAAEKRPTHGMKQVFIAERSEIPLWEEKLDFNTHETGITWNIPRPINGYYYFISWA